MKWYRTLKFHKRHIDEENGYFKIIADNIITSFVLDKAKYYQLKFKKVNFSDFYTCTVELWGDRDSFLAFVQDFVNEYKNYVTDVSF